MAAAKAHGTKAIAAALLATSLTLSAPAGGYLSFFGGVVDAWSGTVTVNLDLGGLGSLTNGQADTLTLNALNTWDLGTVNLTFAQGGDLGSDQTGANSTIFTTAGDGISPIAYDTDGSLTDAILGAGASTSVLGFAGPQDFSGNTITEGRAALNGLFINGTSGPGDPADVSQTQFQGVIAHEFGHMLNLDHAQHNAAFARALTPGNHDARDFTGFPTMYPLVHNDIETLANDDEQWISSLYPTAGFTSSTSTFTGIVYDSGGSPLDGINVVCRLVDNPRVRVISCVSGYFSGGTPGEFMIPGLVPGEAYVLDIEQIRGTFTQGSRVGPLTSPGSQLSFAATGLPEFINRVGDEGPGDSLSHSSTFIAPTGGMNTNLPDLTLNGAPSTSTPVAEVDPGASIAAGHWDDITSDVTTAVMAGEILRISGTADDAETGDLDFSSGDIDDYFLIDANTAAFPLEVFDITVTPSGGAVDLYVISWDAGDTGFLSATGSTSGGVGVAETIDRFWDPSRFGSGGVDGFMLIGIGSDGGSVSYTLDIMATHLDTQGGGAVYVGGVNTNGGLLHVNGTDTNTIIGEGFSSAGGGPIVTTDDPNINVDSVTFVSPQQVDVVLSDGGGFTPAAVTLTVTNAAAAGGASGDLEMINTAVPVELSVFQAE